MSNGELITFFFLDWWTYNLDKRGTGGAMLALSTNKLNTGNAFSKNIEETITSMYQPQTNLSMRRGSGKGDLQKYD